MTLSEQYMSLARKLAQQHVEKFCYRYDYSDFESVAYLALVEAERTYNDQRGTGFAAYVTSSIRNKIFDYVNATRKHTEHTYSIVSFAECAFVAQDYNGENLDFEGKKLDLFECEEDAFAAIDFFQTFQVFLSTLKPDEQFLVSYRLQYPDTTQKDCAEALSTRFQKRYSQVTISNMLKRTQSKYVLYEAAA